MSRTGSVPRILAAVPFWPSSLSGVSPVTAHAQTQAAAPVGDPTGAVTGTAKDVTVKDPETRRCRR